MLDGIASELAWDRQASRCRSPPFWTTPVCERVSVSRACAFQVVQVAAPAVDQ